jgi:hypothetical protein
MLKVVPHFYFNIFFAHVKEAMFPHSIVLMSIYFKGMCLELLVYSIPPKSDIDFPKAPPYDKGCATFPFF